MTDFVITPSSVELRIQAAPPDAASMNTGLTAPILKAINPDDFEDCEFLIQIHPALYKEQRLSQEMQPADAVRYRLFLQAIDATLCEFRHLLRDLFLLVQPFEAPYPILPFLSPIVGVDFNYDVPEEFARREIANAIFLWKRKGTRDNIADWIGFISGFKVVLREYYKEVLRSNVYNQSYLVDPNTFQNQGGPNYATLPHLSETHTSNTWNGNEANLPFFQFNPPANSTYGVHGYTQLPGKQEGFYHKARWAEGWGDFQPLPGTEKRIESVGPGDLLPGYLFRNHVGVFLDIIDDQIERTWFGEPVLDLFLDKIARIIDLICFYGVVKHVIWRIISEDDAFYCEQIVHTVIPRYAEGWNDIEPLGSPFTQTETKSCDGIGEECVDCIGDMHGLQLEALCISGGRLAEFILCTNDPDRVTNDAVLDSDGGPWLTWFYANYWSEQAGRYPTGIPTMGTPGAQAAGDILQTWTPTYLSTFTSEVVIPAEISDAEALIGEIIGTGTGQGLPTIESISQYIIDLCENGRFEDNILNIVEEWDDPFQDTEIFDDTWDVPELFADTEIFFDDWDIPDFADNTEHEDDWNIDSTFQDNLEVSDNWNITDAFEDTEIFCEDWEPTVPLTLTGPGFWLDGNNGPKANSPVGVWLDRFNDPGGNDATQSMSASQPDLDKTDSDFNDFGTVTFDGVNDYMSIPDDTSLNGNTFSVFVVMQWNNPNYGETPISKNTDETLMDGWGFIHNGSNDLRFYVDDFNAHYVDINVPNNTPSIICARYDGSRLEALNNGQLAGVSLYGGGVVNSANDVTIGAHSVTGGVSGYFGGQIAEIIYYDRALSSDEKSTILDYLSTKYAITVDTSTEIVTEPWDFDVTYVETPEVTEPFDFDVTYVDTPETIDPFDFDQVYNTSIEVNETWEELNLPDTPVLEVTDDFNGAIAVVEEPWDFDVTYVDTSEVVEPFDFDVTYVESGAAADPFNFDQTYVELDLVEEPWDIIAPITDPGTFEYFEHWYTDDRILVHVEDWNGTTFVVDSTSFTFTEDWEPAVFVIDSSSFTFTELWESTVFVVDSSSFQFFENWNGEYIFDSGSLQFFEDWDPTYLRGLLFFDDWEPPVFVVDSSSFTFTETWEPTVFGFDSGSFVFSETWESTVFLIDFASFPVPENWDAEYDFDSGSFIFSETWEPTVFLTGESATFQFGETWEPTEFTRDYSGAFQWFEDWDG